VVVTARPWTLHLVRGAEPPDGVVGDGDRVLYDRDGAWTDGARRLTDEELVDLVFLAARVAVW
jgi:hypothetical protein